MKIGVRPAVLAAVLLLAFSFGAQAQEKKTAPAVPIQSFDVDMRAAEEAGGLLASSLHAAAALSGYLSPVEAGEAPILVASFVNLEDLDDSSPFGRLVAHQIGSAMGQAGFRVIENKLRGQMVSRLNDGEFMVTRDQAQTLHREFKAYAVLVGYYSATSSDVFVSSRLCRLEDGALLAAYEYVVPNRGAVAQLLDREQLKKAWGKYAQRPPAFDLAAAAPAPAVMSRTIEPRDEPPAEVQSVTPKRVAPKEFPRLKYTPPKEPSEDK